jgi:SAM-dependent methyltransferase
MQTDSNFDNHADSYNASLAKGISVSGEDKNYFAEGRIRHLERRLLDINFSLGTVLDFGCGTGGTIPFFFDILKAKRCIGTDTSIKSVEIARELKGLHDASFEVGKDYVPCGDVDLVYCNGVFHHIPPHERHAALTIVFNALRPGGLFAFCENNPWNLGTRYVMSRIPFDCDAITISAPNAREMLRIAGFEVLCSDYLFFFPRSLSWARWLEQKLTAMPLGAQYMVLARKSARD